MKKYVIPFITIVLGSLALQLFKNYVYIYAKDTVVAVLTSLLLFIFGMVLNQHHDNSNGSWLKKVIIFSLYVVFVLYYLGMVSIPSVTAFLETIGITRVIYYMFFIYFGYIFVE